MNRRLPNLSPVAWPTSSDLRVEKFSARYSQVLFFAKISMKTLTGPVVLHDLSFHIKYGQRIGVDKSSLRCSRIIDG